MWLGLFLSQKIQSFFAGDDLKSQRLPIQLFFYCDNAFSDYQAHCGSWKRYKRGIFAKNENTVVSESAGLKLHLLSWPSQRSLSSASCHCATFGSVTAIQQCAEVAMLNVSKLRRYSASMNLFVKQSGWTRIWLHSNTALKVNRLARMYIQHLCFKKMQAGLIRKFHLTIVGFKWQRVSAAFIYEDRKGFHFAKKIEDTYALHPKVRQNIGRAVMPHLQACFLCHLLEMLKESTTQTAATMISQSKSASTKCCTDRWANA